LHPVSAPLEGSAAPGAPLAPAGNGHVPSRLRRIDDLVMEMSVQDDAERLVRVFARQGAFLVRRDGFLSLSRRDLVAPHYRITRSWRWREPINPWTEAHRLPLLDRGLLGELLYVGKPAVLNRLEVDTDDPAREHLDGMRSLACVPSYDHGEPLNMVTLLSRESDAFTATDLENFLLHANLLGRAVTTWCWRSSSTRRTASSTRRCSRPAGCSAPCSRRNCRPSTASSWAPLT